MKGVCPTCRKEISSTAKTCVHCGCKFKYNSFPYATRSAHPMGLGASLAIGGVGGLGATMIVLTFLFGDGLCLLFGLLLLLLACILEIFIMKKKIKEMLEYEYFVEKKKQSNPNASRPFINPVTPTPAPSVYTNNNANAEVVAELKRYKELLDTDIITQQEFDEKKRNLLGM